MSAPRLTDAQLDTALRSIAPSSAPAGLRAGIVAQAAATRQRRPAAVAARRARRHRPAARRRAVLLAAALLAASRSPGRPWSASFLIDRPKTPLLEQTRRHEPHARTEPGRHAGPPADVGALVGSAYSRMPDAAADDHQRRRRDGDDPDLRGRLRRRPHRTLHGRIATTPDTYEILSGTRKGELLAGPDGPGWHEQDDAISEDPRVFVYAALGQSGWTMENTERCQTTTSPDGQASSAPPTAWSYVGAELVAGRAAYHVECGGRDLWLDAGDADRVAEQRPGRGRGVPRGSRPDRDHRGHVHRARAAACRSVRDACAGRCPGPR